MNTFSSDTLSNTIIKKIELWQVHPSTLTYIRLYIRLFHSIPYDAMIEKYVGY